MIKLLIYLILFSKLLLAYDSIEVLNDKMTIHKSGWYKTNKELSTTQAKNLFTSNKFKTFSKAAKTFGFTNETFWFAFEITIKESIDPLLLNIRDITKEKNNLYIFENNKLLKEEQNGYITPMDERKINSFPISFKLVESNQKLLYLIKSHSIHPQYNAFAFGSRSEIQKDWDIRHTIFIFTSGIFIALMLYNSFIYLITRDLSYLYYSVYVSGLYVINLLIYGYLNVIFPSMLDATAFLISIAMQIEIIGLVFFTEYFLHLKQNDQFMKKTNRYVLLITIVSMFAIPIAKEIQLISIIALNILFLLLLYTAFRSYKRGFTPALYYMLATGVTLITIILFMFMHQWTLIPYNVWTFNLTTFGLIWDMIVLSFALAYRIKILQTQNLEKERLLLIQSKYSSAGELTGNIAHQWRTPLGSIGSIFTNLQAKSQYGNLSNEELKNSLNLGNNIIQHLSETIDTFNSFFKANSKDEILILNEFIQELLLFLKDMFKENNITIEYESENDFKLKTKKNELSQVLINLIVNAKDAIVNNNIKNGKIMIKIFKENEKIFISIEDNGGGIKIEPIEDVFKPYISSKDDGAGIGLYITKELIQNVLHFNIIAENINKGARFTIKLIKVT